MFVCQMISLDIGSSVYLQAIQVKFVYEGHRVKVKVTGAENVPNAYSCNVNFDCP